MSSNSIPPLKPQVALPPDEGLPDLLQLFDSRWVWQRFTEHFGQPEVSPKHIRALQFSYRPGTRALVNYTAGFQNGSWEVDDHFAIELVGGKPNRVFRYPNDPYLPGLQLAGDAASAHDLLTRYVGGAPHRVRVELVRYRPATRAVLRHVVYWRPARLGSLKLYARVMPVRRLDRLLTAAEMAERSGFQIPPVRGVWRSGGVAWMSEVPGETVREKIRRGAPPSPRALLEALAGLWDLRVETGKGHPLDVLGGFDMTERLLSQLLGDGEPRRLLEHVTDILGPFARAWQPSAMAHNDFYGEQVLVTPEAKLALVDFEEIGPGDPLLDVANMMAHLRWMARFGTATEACTAYRRDLRSAALAHFGCDGRALDLREA